MSNGVIKIYNQKLENIRKYCKKATNEELAKAYCHEIEDGLNANIKNIYESEIGNRGEKGLFAFYKYYIKYFGILGYETDEYRRKYLSKQKITDMIIKIGDTLNPKMIYEFAGNLMNLTENHAFDDYSFDLTYLSEKLVQTGNLKYNLDWIETFLDYNNLNIKYVIKSKNADACERLVRCVSLKKSVLKSALKYAEKSKNYVKEID